MVSSKTEGRQVHLRDPKGKGLICKNVKLGVFNQSPPFIKSIILCTICNVKAVVLPEF